MARNVSATIPSISSIAAKNFSIVWMAMPLIINMNTCILNIIHRPFVEGFSLVLTGHSKWEIMRSSLHDSPSVTLMSGFGLCINSLWSADSVLWRVVSPGALAAWQVPHLTEARLNVLDRSIALPGVPGDTMSKEDTWQKPWAGERKAHWQPSLTQRCLSSWLI